MYHEAYDPSDKDDEDVEPSYDDLAIDDTLTDLERVKRYVSSQIALQRLVHVKIIGIVANQIGFSAVMTDLIPLLDVISIDVEFVVRQNVAEQLVILTEYCVKEGGEQGYRVILENILPIVSTMITDKKAEVRVSSGEALVAIAQYVHIKDMGQYVLTIVLQLAHDDANEDLRMTAAVLLNELAEKLGTELVHQFVVPELISLSEDPRFRVRKATALNFESVCMTAGPEATMRKLLPAYLRLTQDDVWGVRKACAEGLVEISRTVDVNVRASLLIEVFERLSTDGSRWVRNAAYQQLGPFIATLDSEKVTPSLLKAFTNLVSPATTNTTTATAATTTTTGTNNTSSSSPINDETMNELSMDVESKHELTLYCAFSFPAVALTIGRERWNEIKGCFETLVRDMLWKVRRTLSFSLHEIAKILGPEMTESELLPTFDLFLRDLDEVRVGILTHIADFIGVLSVSSRESYLPVLNQIKDNIPALNWRFREILAGQLSQLATLFSGLATHTVVVELFFDLLNDSVASVRSATLPSIPALLNYLHSVQTSAQWRDLFCDRLVILAQEPVYTYRKLYLQACDACIVSDTTNDYFDREIFITKFLPAALELKSDKVVNVRITLGSILSTVPEWLAVLPQVEECARWLLLDLDSDVRYSVYGAPGSPFAELYSGLMADGSIAAIIQQEDDRRTQRQAAPFSRVSLDDTDYESDDSDRRSSDVSLDVDMMVVNSYGSNESSNDSSSGGSNDSSSSGGTLADAATTPVLKETDMTELCMIDVEFDEPTTSSSSSSSGGSSGSSTIDIVQASSSSSSSSSSAIDNNYNSNNDLPMDKRYEEECNVSFNSSDSSSSSDSDSSSSSTAEKDNEVHVIEGMDGFKLS